MDRAMDRMVEFAQRLHAGGADAWAVNYAHNPDVAERFVERCQKVFRREPEFVTEAGPVVSTHVGPGWLLLAGMNPSSLG
jgi:fatty acid-binding protein DegV